MLNHISKSLQNNTNLSILLLLQQRLINHIPLIPKLSNISILLFLFSFLLPLLLNSPILPSSHLLLPFLLSFFLSSLYLTSLLSLLLLLSLLISFLLPFFPSFLLSIPSLSISLIPLSPIPLSLIPVFLSSSLSQHAHLLLQLLLKKAELGRILHFAPGNRDAPVRLGSNDGLLPLDVLARWEVALSAVDPLADFIRSVLRT